MIILIVNLLGVMFTVLLYHFLIYVSFKADKEAVTSVMVSLSQIAKHR